MKTDEQVFSEVAEALVTTTANAIQAGSKSFGLVSLIDQYYPEPVAVLHRRLSMVDVHGQYLCRGVANALIAKLSPQFPQLKMRFFVVWGQEPSLQVY